MPTIMVILNVVFIAGVVLGIVGLLAWGIVADRSLVPARGEAAMARARARDRRRVSGQARTTYRGSRRPMGVGA